MMSSLACLKLVIAAYILGWASFEKERVVLISFEGGDHVMLLSYDDEGGGHVILVLVG